METESFKLLDEVIHDGLECLRAAFGNTEKLKNIEIYYDEHREELLTNLQKALKKEFALMKIMQKSILILSDIVRSNFADIDNAKIDMLENVTNEMMGTPSLSDALISTYFKTIEALALINDNV